MKTLLGIRARLFNTHYPVSVVIGSEISRNVARCSDSPWCDGHVTGYLRSSVWLIYRLLKAIASCGKVFNVLVKFCTFPGKPCICFNRHVVIRAILLVFQEVGS